MVLRDTPIRKSELTSERPTELGLKEGLQLFLRILGRWVRRKNPFARTLLTLAVEEDGVHLVEFRGAEVMAWNTLSLPADLIKDGATTEPRKLGKLLSVFMAQNRARRGSLVSSVSGYHCLSRVITLPRLPVAALREAVQRETSRAMPIAMEESHLSWQVLSRVNGQQKLFVLATPRNGLDTIVRALREGKALRGRVELKPVALARLVKQEQAVVVDIQSRSVDVVIVQRGVPAFFRTLSRDEGSPITSSLEEISRTIDFFNRNQTRERLNPESPLIVTGSASDDPATMEQLVNAVQRPVEPLDIPLRCPHGFSSKKYAVNLALALGAPTWKSAEKGQSVTLDVVPAAYQPSHRVLELSATLAAIPLGLAALFLLYQMSDEASTARAEAQVKWYQLDQKLAQNRLAKKEVTRAELAVKQTQDRAERLEREKQTIMAKSPSYAPTLGLVNKALPAGVRLEGIALTGRTMSLEGRAANYEAVVKYVTALEQSGRFSAITMKNVSKPAAQDTEIAFSLEATGR